MKPDETRAPIKHRHEQDRAAPTVIHDPEQDMNLLERWLRHAMENQVQFWSMVVVLVAVMVGLSLLASGMQLGKGSADQAWSKLDAAKTAEEREEIAREFPNTPAQRSALLLAASEYYMKGFADLPANKEVALPTLKKALDLFQKVAEEAPPTDPQGRAAALNVGRTYEARNEIDKALAQYQRVAQNSAWKGTNEATEAARLAALLEKPETVAFYKELYAYKPVEATLPAGGSANFGSPSPGMGTIPGLGGGNPLTAPLKLPDSVLGASKQPATTETTPIKLPDASAIPLPPPEPTGPKTISLTPSPAPKAVMPAPVPLPSPAAAPKAAAPAPKPAAPAPKAATPAPKPAAATPKIEAPTPKPAPAAPKPEVPKSTLPSDPFASKPAAPAPKPATSAPKPTSTDTLPADPFRPAKK